MRAQRLRTLARASLRRLHRLRRTCDACLLMCVGHRAMTWWRRGVTVPTPALPVPMRQHVPCSARGLPSECYGTRTCAGAHPPTTRPAAVSSSASLLHYRSLRRLLQSHS